MVAGHELDRPAGLALQDEDDVAGRGGLVVVPVGDEGVDDEVALGPPRLPPGVGLAQGVVALEGAGARELEGAVGAVGGDDVVGATVVEGVGVRGRWSLGRPRRPRRTSSWSSLHRRLVHADHRRVRARCVYRPVGLNLARPRTGGARRGSEVVGTPGAVCDRGSRTGPPRSATSTRTSSQLEAEQLWPRVWQMACRLEEIPEPGDYVTYEILDQSVIVLRTDDGEVRAFQNTCRHRGVRLVEGRGHLRERVHLPVPRVVLRPGRHEHPHPDAQVVRPSTTCSPTTST